MTYMEEGINRLSRPKFIPTLFEELKKLNFKYVDIQGHRLRFVDETEHRTLDYFVNVSFPEHVDKINLPKFRTVIAAGFGPNAQFLEQYGDSTYTFIGFEGTIYHHIPDEENENNIFYKMNNDSEFRAKFDSFVFYTDDLQKHTFKTWNDFLQKSTARKNQKNIG